MLPKTHANPDLVAGESHRPHWNEPENRRHGFHNLHRIARYGQSYRAGSVLQLETAADLAIARRDDVARHCASPWFSAMVVARAAVRCCSNVTPPISHAISRTRSCRSRKP